MTQTQNERELFAHLFRRAGFGATQSELDAAIARGYEAVVDDLVDPEQFEEVDIDPFTRVFPETEDARNVLLGVQGRWLFQMINTRRPLEEKMTLFWHMLFATAESKLEHSWLMLDQIDMLRAHALGDFKSLLVALSKNPAMLYWLDNQENTKDVHNENYGRELLELFSLGIGNYTEDDVKACSRAFTGWTIDTTIHMGHAHGRHRWQFVFKPELHDYSEKVFLGERGNFDGADIIDIIVRQPATAQFIARRLHLFFVSDVPDEKAIADLAKVFVGTRGDIRAVLRALFLSEAFRAPSSHFAKVKSPTEVIVAIARLVGGFDAPGLHWGEFLRAPRYMGQDIMNPPSVEGWHTGNEWIDSGLLIERVNFAAAEVADPKKPGVKSIIEAARAAGLRTPEEIVAFCLDRLGPLTVTDRTRGQLIRVAREGDVLRVLSFAVASPEYQLC